MNTNIEDSAPLPRSHELMSRTDTALLVVDVQGKLIRLVPGHQRIIWNIGRLIEAAKTLGVPIAATEQYPKGLGPTVPELAQQVDNIYDKVTFSCGSCDTLWNELKQQDIYRVLVVGIEAHVCVQQTVFDLLSAGMRVYLAVDAIGARFDIDYQTALRRMDSAGATLTTTEAAIFEWCERSDIPEFKTVSQLIQQTPPEA